MKKISNYINGKLVAPASGKYIDLYDPSTGQVYAQVPESDITDVNQAVSVAQQAFAEWSSTSVAERSRVMTKIADLIDANLERLAKAESLDNGKPVWLAKKVDIPRASSNMRFFAQAITQFSTAAHEMTNAINYTCLLYTSPSPRDRG